MDKFILNELFKRAPISSKQANIRADIKASRMPSDKNAHLSKIDNKINKIIHHIKTKGNSLKAKRALIKTKMQRIKIAKKE